jgi:translation initiation factor IF-1
MAKQTNITVEGVITEALGNLIFRAELDNGHTVVAHLSGKIRLNSIQILPGDFVQMEMSPYDLSKARIVRRISTRTKIE